MVFRCAILLFLAAASAWALPRSSSKDEIRGMARLPKVEFATPLHFDRKAGFVVFPDTAAASAEAAEILGEAKAVPAEAGKYLQAAYRYEANGDYLNGLKYFAWAADLFRRRVESEPGNAQALAGLAESLVSIGRGAEAQAHLEKALGAADNDAAVQASAASVLRERAWQAIVGEQRIFAPAGFMETLAELLRQPPSAPRIAESRQFLSRAAEAMQRAGELAPGHSAVQWQRAAFFSFHAAFAEFLRQLQAGESRIKEVQISLFDRGAMDALSRAAELSQGPGRISAAALASLVGRAPALIGREGSIFQQEIWPRLPRDAQEQMRGMVRRLAEMAAAGSTNAAAASEQLGSLQLCVLRDFEGARRSFGQAVARDPKRHRSWELLVLATFMEGETGQLVEICSSRFESLPNARSGALLAKAYDRAGDASRAELVAMTGLAAHPNDFLLNLSLAALLLKRESGDGIWRVNDLLRKAEKQIGRASTAQNRLDLALAQSIYLALTGRAEEARAVLKPHLSTSSEAQELMALLDR
jgi:tetratricopeptide (TPR) repeat protein